MAVFNSLTIGGINSLDYGIYITGEGVYDAPNRAVEMVEIHGRNGALILDKGHFENIEIKYPCGSFGESGKTFEQRITEFKNAVLSLKGYQRLTDTYATDVYRLASCANGFEVAPVQGGKAGEFDLVFNCKPQRFLTSGETLVTVANNGELTNPTQFDSQPVIQVEGYGTVTFNGYEIELTTQDIGTVELSRAQQFIASDESLSLNVIENEIAIDTSLLNQGDAIRVNRANIESYYANCYIYYSDDAYTWVTVSKTPSANIESVSVGSNTAYGRKNVYIQPHLKPASFVYGTASTFSGTATIDITFQKNAVSYHSIIAVTLELIYNGAGKIKMRFTRAINSDSEGIINFNNTRYFANVIWDAVGDSSQTILGHPTYIDCELGEAYKIENNQFISLNAYIDLGSDLPTLASGTNTFTKSNTITSLKVKPNWWKL